jgi:hypothetical protein
MSLDAGPSEAARPEGARFHLAQLNIARLIEPLDSPRLAGFVDLLPVVNALADSAPGFVWRLADSDGGDATQLRPFGADVIVNLTVWETVEALREFVFRSGHVEPLRRRRDWFHPADEAYAVLWWVPVGHLPSIDEAASRLSWLRDRGPGPDAFTLREPHPAPAAGAGTVAS